MGLRYPEQIHCNCFFVTTTFRDHLRLGEVEGVYDALVDSIEFYSKAYEARVAGYVLMPSHLHILLFVDGAKLGSFMRDFKKFIAQKTARQLGLPRGGIWTPRYDRVAINSEEVFRTKLEYIHNNPIKAGLVEKESDWRWSSARDYASDTVGLVPVWKEWA